MKMKEKERKELEQQIIDKANLVQRQTDAGCHDENDLYQYLVAWYQLEKYYEENDVTDIGVEIVREYIDNANYFFGTWKNPDVETSCQEAAEEALRELESHMQYIIAAVERRIYPQGR